MLPRLSVSNQWETATKRIDIRTEQCSSNCEFGIELTAASPGVRVGTRSLGKRVRARLRTSKEGGQAAVEFALVLPILLLIVTAVFAFGIALHDYLELTDAVSIGARLLAINRGQTADPCATAAAAIEKAAPFLNSANMTFTITLNGNTNSGASCTSGAAEMVQNTAATVTVSYPCNLSVFGANLAPNCKMYAQTTEMMQ
jgi:Flp pilus assembly protein TadG